jgi:hypothetical protein
MNLPYEIINFILSFLDKYLVKRNREMIIINKFDKYDFRYTLLLSIPIKKTRNNMPYVSLPLHNAYKDINIYYSDFKLDIFIVIHKKIYYDELKYSILEFFYEQHISTFFIK